MRTRSKIVLASLTAALLLSMAVSAASANRLSVSNRNFRIVWAPLTLDSPIGSDPRCNVTLEGSFHSNTITKTNGLLLGYITRGETSSCVNGTGTVREETLPWHVRYRGFSGALPNITGVALGLIGAGFTISNEFGTCETATTAANPAVGIANVSAGTVTGMRADETFGIPLEGSFLCEIAGSGRFSGTGSVRLLGSTTTALTIRLI